MIPTFTAEAALHEAQGLYRTLAGPGRGGHHELVAALDILRAPSSLGQTAGQTAQNCFQFCVQRMRCDGNCPLEYVSNYGLYRPKCCWREECDPICVPKPV